MRAVYTLIFLIMFMVLGAGINISESRVAPADSVQRQTDGVVTGSYKGYQNQMIYIMFNDGSRVAYPFKADKSLLRRIAKTPISAQVTITVDNGIVVSFEEVN